MKEKLLKSSGVWLVTLEDNSKWVLDLNNMFFDTYKWYKTMGTLETELKVIDDFLKGSWKKIK